MASQTYLAVPLNVTNEVELRRFLLAVVAQLDVAITSGSAALDARIVTNTTDIATNTTDIVTNTTDIAANTTAIATNATNIATNTAGIATNVTSIATNTADIATNVTNIATNTASIATLVANLNNPAITNLALTPITASAAYVQAESQALANDIQSLQTAINSILGSLRLAKIIV